MKKITVLYTFIRLLLSRIKIFKKKRTRINQFFTTFIANIRKTIKFLKSDENKAEFAWLGALNGDKPSRRNKLQVFKDDSLNEKRQMLLFGRDYY